jgi:hypothetical protein
MRATDLWEMLVAKVIRTQPLKCTVLFWRPSCLWTQCTEIFTRQVCLHCQTHKLPVAMLLLPVSGTLRAMDKDELRAGHDTASSGVHWNCWKRYTVQWRILKLLDTIYRTVAYTERAGHDKRTSGVHWNDRGGYSNSKKKKKHRKR